MQVNICSVCKNKYYDEIGNFEGDFASPDEWNESVIDNRSGDSRQRPVRTSTPLADIEDCPSPSFSDSVTDFFYQSWKSGLHSSDSSSTRHSNQRNQLFTVLQPVYYAPYVVYVNTVVLQPYVPTSYIQQVGYRPDGTYGVLGTYWS